MKIAELRKLDQQEQTKRLVETRKELMALRFQKASGELTDTSQLLKNRRTVARLKGLLSEAKKADTKAQ